MNQMSKKEFDRIQSECTKEIYAMLNKRNIEQLCVFIYHSTEDINCPGIVIEYNWGMKEKLNEQEAINFADAIHEIQEITHKHFKDAEHEPLQLV